MPNHGLIAVEKENDDGTVSGFWIEGVCASTLHEAKERANIYSNDLTPTAVISVHSGFIGTGRYFFEVKPLYQNFSIAESLRRKEENYNKWKKRKEEND